MNVLDLPDQCQPQGRGLGALLDQSQRVVNMTDCATLFLPPRIMLETKP